MPESKPVYAFSYNDLAKADACLLDDRWEDMQDAQPDCERDDQIPASVWWSLPSTAEEDVWWSLRVLPPEATDIALALLDQTVRYALADGMDDAAFALRLLDGKEDVEDTVLLAAGGPWPLRAAWWVARAKEQGSLLVTAFRYASELGSDNLTDILISKLTGEGA